MLVYAMKFVFVLAWLSLVHAMGKEDGFALQCKSVAKCIYRTKGEGDKKWPSASSGTVYMYKSEERFKGNVYSRFFHVFVAKGIKNKNLKEALRLCEIYNDKKNQHIIFNFKGVIHLIKNDLELSEQYFIKSTEIQPKYEDPIKNLYLVYLDE